MFTQIVWYSFKAVMLFVSGSVLDLFENFQSLFFRDMNLCSKEPIRKDRCSRK